MTRNRMSHTCPWIYKFVYYVYQMANTIGGSAPCNLIVMSCDGNQLEDGSELVNVNVVCDTCIHIHMMN